MFLWAHATSHLCASCVADLIPHLATYLVGRFHDSHDEFVTVPLPADAVDLSAW